MDRNRLLDLWDVTREELDEIIQANPSLRGIVFGYVAEYKLRKIWFSDQSRITDLVKYDDHDRRKKHDVEFRYKGMLISVEVKSLQTATVKQTDQGYTGRFQCDASDRRKVTFPTGETIETTCLLAGDFDMLAVNCFQFGRKWRFAFARNKDLPRSRYTKYKPEHRQFLLATLMDVTWPVQPPFVDEPFRLLDQIVQEKMQQ